MRMVITISSLISLVTAGCATSPTEVRNARPVAKARIVQVPVAAHSERAAQVTIVRDVGALGSAPSAAITLNGKPVASFRPRESLTFSVDPGDYVFGLEPVPNLGVGLREYSLNAKPGEHYYYRITVTTEGLILQRSYAVSQ
jgi:hypothetical protein